jgi:DNA (cytosine-5)-methyltransferase 1
MAEIDYPAHLEMMWQKAIAPREPDAPTVVSTFAGGGGSLTGYMMAGFRDLLAVEWDDNAVETLRLNWPDLDIYHGDITKLTVEEVLQRTGLKPGELDVLDGSPPCQGFSTAGKRVLDDPRNQLFREYVRLLRGLMPKVFIMENVSGMVKGKMKLVFVEILKELKASGYKVSARLLNAMYFHVPQSRQRMIFIGIRDDLGIEPSHPKAESRPITPKMAIDDLTPDIYDPFPDWLKTATNFMDAGNYSNMHVLKAFMKTKGTPGGSQSFKLLSWDRQSCTIARVWPGAAGVGHPNKQRYLASNELKRIGSFPDGYQFIGGYKKTIERIGNSVPPLMIEAIARHIKG